VIDLAARIDLKVLKEFSDVKKLHKFVGPCRRPCPGGYRQGYLPLVQPLENADGIIVKPDLPVVIVPYYSILSEIWGIGVIAPRASAVPQRKIEIKNYQHKYSPTFFIGWQN
jgi:hypothetical protein